MRRHCGYIVLFSVLILLSACRPKGVLSTGEMTDVLFDIHLVEAMTNTDNGQLPLDWTQGMSDSNFKDMAYQSVLNKHGISEADFYVSVAYYSRHMRQYTLVYTDLGKRYDAYAQSIDTWSENLKTAKAVQANMLQENALMKERFERMHVKPDTASVLTNSYLPGKVISYITWKVDRLLPKSEKRPTTYLVIDTVTVVNTNQPIAVDSVATNAAVATVKPLLKDLMSRPIPMDELLRLKAEGLIDDGPTTPVQTPPAQPDKKARYVKDSKGKYVKRTTPSPTSR